MITGMYSAAQGMDVATARHELAAANIAFASLPGYMRSTWRPTLANAGREDTPEASAAAGEPPQLGVDFTPGRIERTGRALDLALHGEGFLVVEGPDGPLYTRCGRLHVDAQGQLVTTDGLPVRGHAGPLRVPPGTSAEQIRVSPAGQIGVGDTVIGQLQLVRFTDPGLLSRAGATLFTAPDDAVPVPATATVAQGLIEQSNVQPLAELVSLLVAARQYEASQLALKSLHSAIGQHINR